MRKRVAFGVAAAACCAWFLLYTPAEDARAEGSDPPRKPAKPAFVTTRVIGQLSEDRPLRLRLGGFFDPSRGTQQKLMFFTQLHYTGDLNESAVVGAIQTGKAHALEHRLGRKHGERLATAMAESDATLRDVALVIDEEQARIKDLLRKRRKSRLEFTTVPKKGSFEFQKLQEEQLAMGNEGALWPEAWGAGVVYLKVKWSEWPALQALVRDRDYVLQERTQLVRNWISREFDVHRMKLFSQ